MLVIDLRCYAMCDKTKIRHFVLCIMHDPLYSVYYMMDSVFFVLYAIQIMQNFQV